MDIPIVQPNIDTDNFNVFLTDYVYSSDSNRLLSHQDHAIAPEFYGETNGVQPKSGKVFTSVGIFSSRHEAQTAVSELQHHGLLSSQIVMVAKNYQEHENSMNWEYIASDDGLVVVLTELGINVPDTFKFVDAVEDGKFLVVAIVTDCLTSRTHHILNNIGYEAIAAY
ncbi:MAG: hypothetical protein DCF19_16200 [Pseudanabaena frigida]|uniref:Uncharacterized protein n=1 Tax=Pseudanabaena frigida TaxID=945775 RepID=A0A2W4XV17_9CYAN|nr:MAG: hypothetical protein DCF19_16200 [Pseudanabaena frigida]